MSILHNKGKLFRKRKIQKYVEILNLFTRANELKLKKRPISRKLIGQISMEKAFYQF